MKNVLFIAFALLGTLTFYSCEKDDPDGGGEEEEVITTMTMTMTPTGDASSVVFSFTDLDGDGGNAPTITSGALKPNLTYAVSIELLNEQADPTEDITAEVQEEDDEHQFFFSVTTPGVTWTYSDTDDAGNPVGLASQVTTGDANTGTVTVVLRHEPNKDGEGVSEGDITNAGGESDIEVTFDLNVE